MNEIAARNGAGLRSPRGREQPVQTSFEPESQSPRESSFSVTLLAVYIFLLSSRALDVSRLAILHIPMVLLTLLAIIALARGLGPGLGSKITVGYAALNCWILVCLPLSMWRTGSLPYVISSVESFGVHLIIIQIARTGRDWRRVATAYAMGVPLRI
jgi:hypothetical protein